MKFSFSLSILSSAWLIKMILLPLIASVVQVEAVPYFLLTSSRPKCVTVKAPQMSTLLINYNAPDMSDMALDDSKPEPKAKEEQGINDIDSKYKQRREQKMEEMKRASRLMKDISISVNQKGRRDDPKVSSSRAARNAGTGRLRQDLTEKSGLVEYETGTFDGDVEICLQSISAQPRSPSRVSVNVDQEHTQSYNKKKKQDENSNTDNKETSNDTPEQKKSSADEAQRRAERHITRMEGELVQLNRKMANILSQADFSKEQEAEFHEQSLAMSRASQYWPMLHLIVLLITGFTQASHIVRFFKSRHIM